MITSSSKLKYYYKISITPNNDSQLVENLLGVENK